MSSPSRKLLQRASELLVYPVREMGWMSVLFGAGLHFGANFLFELSSGASVREVRRGGAGALGLLLIGYLMAYLFRVVSVSASGERSLPDWPLPARWRKACLTPVLLTLVLTALVLAPGILAAIILPGTGLASLLLLAGALVWPIGLLGLALDRSLEGLSPTRAAAAIQQAPVDYGLVALLNLGIFWLASSYGADVVADGPVVAALSSLVFVYFLLVDGHAIGRFYDDHAEQLGWFGEADDATGPAFHGIGASLRKTDRGAEVVDVLEGGGADRVGLGAGDEIRVVDGTPISELSLDDITDRIQGPSGTSVQLRGESADGAPFVEEVVRQSVEVG